MAGMKIGNVIGVIPARYGSTRFPGKPLHPIAGKPLIQHVVDRCRLASSLSDVIVATDDQRIYDLTSQFCLTVMTRPDHPSGTDRIAEVAKDLDCDAVVNIQGDEPLIDPTVINDVAAALETFEMSTAVVRISSGSALQNPNIVKVVVDQRQRALYFSRSMIPFVRDAASLTPDQMVRQFTFYHHMGIYGYRIQTLNTIVKLPVSPLESLESLEQLRALEAGITIGVAFSDRPSQGVDTPEDVATIEKLLNS